MAFDTYDNLKKAVLKQTHRNDLGVKFDDFLAITEVEIRSNSESALLMNLNEKISTATTSTTTRFLALPDRFQSSRKFTITINDNIRGLEFRTPDQLRIRNGSGTPCFFTVRNNEIEFDILPEDEYLVAITYIADLSPLSASNQTNDILTKYPNIYLYGCLKQAFIFSQDTDQAAIYDGLFSESINSANDSEHSIKYPTQPQETEAWSP
jgi:hypothetical protein